MSKPFLYVASVRRTGSTMLAELLSDPPAAYVFREPRLVKGRLRLKPDLIEYLETLRLPVHDLSQRMRGLEKVEAIASFRRFCLEHEDRVRQFGVKEIRHEGWEAVSDAFPDLKLIVTARDPRDIYLSMFHKRQKLEAREREWSDPEVLAADVNREFAEIRRMMERHPHHLVRYEDVVRSDEALSAVRTFAESDVENSGILGRTSKGNFEKHGEAIGDSRVELWRRERDEEGIRGMMRAFELMNDYADFFGYRLDSR